MDVSQEKSVTKIYRTPQVVLYGDIREITRSSTANTQHANDNAPHNPGNGNCNPGTTNCRT